MNLHVGPSIMTNWGELWYLEIMARLGLACLLGLLVGIERERREHSAGMRTHALVATASAMFMLVSVYGFPLVPAGTDMRFDPGRIAAQVVSGIGFLGAGVIFMRRNTVHGLTTAASIWAVCGLGLAAGGGLYFLAAAGAVFMLIIQSGLRNVEQRLFLHRETRHRITIDADHALDLLPAIRDQVANTNLKVQAIEFDRDADDAGESIQLTLQTSTTDAIVAFIHGLETLPGVHHVGWKHGRSQMLSGDRSGVTALFAGHTAGGGAADEDHEASEIDLR